VDTLVTGRYRLVEQIGRGGMGTVWRAEDTVLGRDVAVKVLTPRPEADEQEQRCRYERMRREARSAALIAHRNVVVVHDIVEDEQSLPCIIMELVRGMSLAQAIKQAPLAPLEVARIGCEVLAALRAAHSAGVLHRDVKPGNVLLADDGRVVLTDFGIAVWAGASSLTQTGEMAGSAGYIAPERLYGGGEPGPASDLWALGATLYCAVEGRDPFERPTALETAYASVVEEPHPMRRAGALAPVIEGLLAKDPQARLSAGQAEQLLRAAANREPASPQPTALPTNPTEPAASQPFSEPRTDQDVAVGRRARRSRRLRRAAGAAGMAAVTIAALAWDTVPYDHHPAPRTAATPSPADSPACDSPTASTTLPAGYRWAHHLGATVAVPTTWRTKERQDGQQVDFVDPTDRVVLRIGRTDLAGTDSATGWKTLEQSLSKQLKDYRRLRLDNTCQHGRPAAVWEFTWRASVPYRAIDLGWSDAHQNGDGIYLSAPSAQWQTYQPVFDTAVATIRTG
jgi:eukaryotic-like serine/threonine-protein kinase